MTCTVAAILAISIHTISGDYNDIHPGAVVKCNNFIAGTYLNSESNISVFAGVEWELSNDLYIEAGLVTGYAHPILPMARLSYEVDKNMRWFIAPAATTNGDLGVVFGPELRF